MLIRSLGNHSVLRTLSTFTYGVQSEDDVVKDQLMNVIPVALLTCIYTESPALSHLETSIILPPLTCPLSRGFSQLGRYQRAKSVRLG